MGAYDRTRIASLQRGLVSLHRAIEGEELRIGAIGLGEDPVTLAVAFTADLFRLLLSRRNRHCHLAIRLRLDLGALLRALRAVGGRALLTLGLHAAKHGFRVFLGQVGALDAHVGNLDAETPRAHAHLVTDVSHQMIALGAHDVADGGVRKRGAQRRIQHAAELCVGALHVEHGLIKQQRVGDAIAHESVDLKALIVGHQDFLSLVFERKDAFVDIYDIVDKRHLHVEARSADEVAYGLAEAQH